MLKRVVAIFQAIFRPYDSAMERIQVDKTTKNKLIYSGYTVMIEDEQKAVDDVMHIFWASIDNAKGAKIMSDRKAVGIETKPHHYKPSVKLVWVTPKAQDVIAYCARVSNPENQENADYAKLLKYCIRKNHVSVFEMASMCLEIKCSRAISRQILRHKSFSAQEFSQRYSQAKSPATFVETRMQDTKNRQSSNPTDDAFIQELFTKAQSDVWQNANKAYEAALKAGVAKETARVLLPEGLTESTMYLTGTARSWLHFLDVRCFGEGVQKECRDVAELVLQEFKIHFPVVCEAKGW